MNIYSSFSSATSLSLYHKLRQSHWWQDTYKQQLALALKHANLKINRAIITILKKNRQKTKKIEGEYPRVFGLYWKGYLRFLKGKSLMTSFDDSISRIRRRRVHFGLSRIIRYCDCKSPTDDKFTQKNALIVFELTVSSVVLIAVTSIVI